MDIHCVVLMFRPAFTGYRSGSTSSMTSMSGSQIVKFNDVQLNRGSAYSSASGIFTVPKPGLYIISCTVRARNDKNFHVRLWKNNQALGYAIGANWKQGGFSIALYLHKNDELYMKHDNATNEEIQNGYTSVFSVAFMSE